MAWENVPVCVCANKIDRPRKVSESEGRKWARDRGYDYFETSAQSGANVSEVFECAFRAAGGRVDVLLYVNFSGFAGHKHYMDMRSQQPSAKSPRATCSSTSERSWTTAAPASRQRRPPPIDSSSP